MPSSGRSLRSKAPTTPKSKRVAAPPERTKPKSDKYITASEFSAGLEDLKQLFLNAQARKTPESADHSDSESSSPASSDDERLRHKPAHKATATMTPSTAKTPTPKRSLKFLEDEASAAQAAAKAALKHAKETSEAVSWRPKSERNPSCSMFD